MRYDFKNLDTAAVEYILTKVDFFSPHKKFWVENSLPLKLKLNLKCVSQAKFFN